MQVDQMGFSGCLMLSFGRRNDDRGWFQKTFNAEALANIIPGFEIAETYNSLSEKNALRGMHFQTPPYGHGKLVTVLTGSILDVLVDLRRGSPTFGKVVSIELVADAGQTLFLPEGIAHGFLSLEAATIVNYAVSSGYQPDHDHGILWSSIDMDWPVAEPIISARDAEFPYLQDFDSPF